MGVFGDETGEFITRTYQQADALLFGRRTYEIMRLGGEIESVVAVRIDDARVTGLCVVRNPEKLSRVERETAFSR